MNHRERREQRRAKVLGHTMALPGSGMAHPDFAVTRGSSGVEIKSVGPTDADTTFFQSIRLKMANNPLERPFAQHPIIYACVHALAANMANTKWGLRPASQERGKPVTNEMSAVFDDPNPLMSTADYFYFISVWLSLSGECIVVKEGANDRVQSVDEMPTELWPLNGRLFRNEVDKSTKLVKYWILNPDTKDEVVYKPHEIIHVRYPNPYDPYRGLPPLAAASQAAATDWLAILYNEAYFKNGGDPGGILMVERSLTPTRRNELMQEWEDRHNGSQKAKRLAVLDQGMKYESISATHRDMEFTTQREWNRSEILAAFRVPPAEAGFYEDVNYSTADVEARRFWTRTMFPIMGIVEDAHWSGLFKYVLGGRYVGRFDKDSVPELQADLSKQLEAADKLKGMGYTPNQIADKIGLQMPRNPWQDRAWTQGNQVDYGSLDASLSGQGEDGSPPPVPAFDPKQVTEIQALLVNVATGQIPSESAYQILIQFYPGMTPENARALLDSVKPAAPAALPGAAPAPAPGAAPATPAPVPTTGSPTSLPSPKPAEAPSDSPLAATATVENRSAERRRLYWKDLHEQHYAPAEKRFEGMVKRWMMSIRAEQLALIARHPKAIANGKVTFNLIGKSNEEGTESLLFDVAKWRKAIGEASRPHYKKVVKAAQDRLAKQIGKATGWDEDSEIVDSLSESLATRVTGVTLTIRNDLRERIGDVLANGGGVKEAQDAVRQTFKVSLSRSLTIARTEIGAASNRATFIAMKEFGVTQQEWVSAGDKDVRDSHDIDGEVVEIGEEFSNGLKHPHDPDGPAEEVINCRCDIAPVLDDADAADSENEYSQEEVEIE